jgi:hypothetical protein
MNGTDQSKKLTLRPTTLSLELVYKDQNRLAKLKLKLKINLKNKSLINLKNKSLKKHSQSKLHKIFMLNCVSKPDSFKEHILSLI